MGKTIVNTALGGLSGRVDQWVYRRHKNQVVVAKRPTPTEAPPSTALAANRDRFRAGRTYANAILADPVRRRVYEALARERGQRVDRLLIGDYLSSPTIDFLEVSGYHGRKGDVIQIGATDDVEVVAVTVTIRRGSGDVLERGPAMKEHGVWRYMATTAVATGENIIVAATARDRPGNETTGECPVSTAA